MQFKEKARNGASRTESYAERVSQLLTQKCAKRVSPEYKKYGGTAEYKSSKYNQQGADYASCYMAEKDKS